MKLCIFIGINVGGAVGWSLGGMVGTMTAFLASGVGSILGVYGGWRVANKLLNDLGEPQDFFCVRFTTVRLPAGSAATSTCSAQSSITPQRMTRLPFFVSSTAG